MPDHDAPTLATPAPDGPTPEPRPGVDPLLGGRVGPYRVLDRLGEGGFGVVYLAEQREPVRRRVAVKVLKPGMDSAEVIARFDTERQALAMMDHPGIAMIFDAGMTAQGRPYFAMEYVQGVPITEYCDSARLGTPERLVLFVEACRAVQHAHQRGIIHRDLKPSNVLVTLVDGAPAIKVIDFGIAKALAQHITGTTVHTRAGHLIGTPEYMSPEQAGTGGVDVDTRSDVYSLGVMLYELLTGLLPFDPGELRRAGLAEIARIIRDVDPPAPSTRLSTLAGSASGMELAQRRRTSADGLRRAVRGELDWITMKALDKDRARRYESPSALAADVERFLNQEPVVAGPPSASYRVRKFVRKHRLAVGGAALIVVLLAVGLAVTGALYRTAEAERRRAEASRAATDREAEKSRAALTFVAGMFQAIDPNAAQGRDVTVREVLDSAAERVGPRLQDQPEVERAVREILGEAYHVIGRPADAEREFRRALALSEAVRGPADPETLQTTHNLGAALLGAGRYAEAVTLLRRAAEGRQRLLGDKDSDTLASLSLLGTAQQRSGDWAGAEASVRSALAGQEALLGPGARDTIDTRNALADLLQKRGNLAEAAQVAEENTGLAVQYLGDTDVKTLESRSIQASIMDEAGNHDGAARIAREVVATKERILGPDHPDTLLSASMLARILESQGSLDECEALRRSVAERSERALGPGHSVTLSNLNNLAQTLHVRAKLDEAEAIYRRVMESRRRGNGPESLETLISMNNLGLLLLDEKKPEEALSLLRATLDGLRRSLPPGHWMIGASCGYVAECLGMLGQHEQVAALFDEGYAILTAALGAGHDRSRKLAASAATYFRGRADTAGAEAWEARAGVSGK